MNTIIYAVIVLGAMAVVFGLILAVAAKVFEVEVDPRLPQIQAALAGQPIPERPPLAKRMELGLEQMELALEDKGEHIACLEARKQLAWYLRGVRFSNYYKQQISRIAKMEDVYRAIRGIQRDLE